MAILCHHSFRDSEQIEIAERAIQNVRSMIALMKQQQTTIIKEIEG
jgi:hypothetical protein